MIEIGKMGEEEYGKLRKMTQRSEKFYEIIKEIGGRGKIKRLKRMSVNDIIKLTKEDIREYKKKD